MAAMSHSAFLFVKDDGMSMEFNVRLCKDQEKIISLIEHGGGLVQRTAEVDIILLIERGSKVPNFTKKESGLNVQYIFDCVEQNKLLDTSEYTLKLEPYASSESSSHSDGDNSSHFESRDEIVNECRSNSKTNDQASEQSATKFNPSIDSRKVIEFLFTNSKKLLGKSRTFLHNYLVQHNIVTHHIDELYEHFRYMVDHIEIYDLSPNEEKLLIKMLMFKVPYSEEEELKMINYIIKNKLHKFALTARPYRVMEEEGLLKRTRASLFRHFKFCIFPRLHEYNLSDHDSRLLLTARNFAPMRYRAIPMKGYGKSDSEESTSSERDLKAQPSSLGKTSKRPGSKNPKAQFDNVKAHSTNDLPRHLRTKNHAHQTDCEKSNFVSKPRECKTVAAKRKYSEKYSGGSDSNNDDFSFDEETDLTHKHKKTSPLSRNKKQTTFYHLNKPTYSSKAPATVQSNVVNGTNQCAPSSKHKLKKVIYSNSVIAKKVASILQKIASGTNPAKKDSGSSNRLNQLPGSGKRTNNEKNKLNQVEDTTASCKDFTQVKTPSSFKDTFDMIGSKDYPQSINKPLVKFVVSNQNMENDSSAENPKNPIGPNDSLELHNNCVVPSYQIEQPDFSNQFIIPHFLAQNDDAHLFKKSDRNGKDNLKNSKRPVSNLQANGIQQSIKEKDVIEDIQIAETPEEMISPTEQSLPDTLSPEECEALKVANGESFVSPKQGYFTEMVSVLKRMEGVVEKVDGNYDLKNDLQNSVNELFSVLYQQRFKGSIRSIMKKDKLSITDKTALLKYIAYAKSGKPQDFIHEFRS